VSTSWLAAHLSEAERLVDAALIEGTPVHERLEALLAESSVRRGRPRGLSVRTLLVAIQLGAFAGRFFLLDLPGLLEPLGPATRTRLGLKRRGEPVSYRQICYLVTRIDEVLRASFAFQDGRLVDGLGEFDRIFNALATTGAHPNTSTVASIAIDGSDIPTWGTSSVKEDLVWEEDDSGQPRIAHDDDGGALWKKARFVTDTDAAWRGGREVEGKPSHFGYSLTVAISAREENGLEVPRAALAARLRPVTVQDKTMGLACIGEVAQRRGRLGDVLADRGYTSSMDGQDFLLPVRALGGEPVFDLTAYQVGPQGTLRGAILIDGRPYSPSTPRALQRIERPTGTQNGTYFPAHRAVRDYQAQIAAREAYAFVAHGSVRDNLTQVFQCPGAAGKLECPLRPARRGLREGALPVLNAPARPGEDSVCARAFSSFSLEEIPLYQRHVYGSTAWARSYSRRQTSVETYFANIKDAAGENFAHGRIRVMGIVKIGLFVAATLASANRRLALSFDPDRIAKRRAHRRPGRPTRHRRLTYRQVVEDATASKVVIRS
jgi:hypothetical protein